MQQQSVVVKEVNKAGEALEQPLGFGPRHLKHARQAVHLRATSVAPLFFQLAVMLQKAPAKYETSLIWQNQRSIVLPITLILFFPVLFFIPFTKQMKEELRKIITFQFKDVHTCKIKKKIKWKQALTFCSFLSDTYNLTVGYNLIELVSIY